MDAEQKTTLKGLPMGLLTWFVNGVGLTLGYKFTMWFLHIIHLS
jgi:hypothetical protein